MTSRRTELRYVDQLYNSTSKDDNLHIQNTDQKCMAKKNDTYDGNLVSFDFWNESENCRTIMFEDEDLVGDTEKNSDIAEDLKNWCIRNKPTCTAVNDLLKTLRNYHSILPSDYRTLMNTYQNLEIETIKPGQYYHFGIKSGLDYVFSVHTCPSEIDLMLNVDGLQLYKSATECFWPVLFKVNTANCFVDVPFIVGLYHGKQKPHCANEFLQKTVHELSVLLRNGYCDNCQNVHMCRLRSITCDSPARYFIKNIKSFNGYYGCDGCHQIGAYFGRMTFPEVDSTERTDDTFRSRLQEEHHRGTSVFEQLDIDMINSFPPDYMHLVCEGAVKKLLVALTKSAIPYRVTEKQMKQMSDYMQFLAPYVPHDFCRKPRSMFHMKKWKATEYRLFIIYLSFIVLKNVHINIYNLFNQLQCLVVIMVHPVLYSKYNDYALDLCKTFLNNLRIVYGSESLVYSFHSMLHLIKVMRIHGPADKFSCFWSENFLHFVKKTVRSSNFPLQQAVKRILEIGVTLQINVDAPVCVSPYNLVQQIPMPSEFEDVYVSCFKKIYLPTTFVSISPPDCYIMCKKKYVYCVDGIVTSTDDNVYFIGKKFKSHTNAFMYPLPSQHFDIFKVSLLSNSYCCLSIDNYYCKVMLLPLKASECNSQTRMNCYYASPIFHTIK